MKKLFLVVLVISVVVVLAAQTFAIPVEISYQGYLTDTGGVPVNGVKNITFKLYTVESEGTEAWSSGPVAVDVSNGVYSVILGDTSSGSTQPPINPAIFADQLWLGITIEADPEMAPRQKLTPVSYSIKALSAQTAESVSWNAVSDKPADFDDSIDNDTLGSLSCITDQIAKWNGSAWVCADLTPQIPEPPPAAPTGVTALSGDGQVTIRWSPVEGATSYNIYWNTTGSVTTSDSAIISAPSPYAHLNLVNGTVYYYVVTAINTYGESSPSVEVSATSRILFSQMLQKVYATDPEITMGFGAVSISGDYAIVGGYGNSFVPGDPLENAGAAYIYHRIGPGTWDTGIKIVAPDVQAGDWFGYSVSIDGDYAIVGAQYEDGGAGDPLSNSGAAYIFHRTGSNTWDSGTKIVALDAQIGDDFGSSVSISGDYAIVGAYAKNGTGAAYLFRRTGTNTWDAGTKIIAPDAQFNDWFGHSVSIDGDYAIVGSPREDGGAGNPSSDAGAAYVFRRTGTNTWDSGVKIVAPDAQAGDYFGNSVSISGDYAVVGANGEDGGDGDPMTYAGAAYIYRRTGTNTWDSGTKIVASDAQAGDIFGCSVAIDGSHVIVAASTEDGGPGDPLVSAGASYIFQRTGLNDWSEERKIVAPDAEANDQFGYSVSMSGDNAIVGANLEGLGGAAYIY